MRIFFRTHTEKRRARRRFAGRFYLSVLGLTLLYGAALVMAFVIGWL